MKKVILLLGLILLFTSVNALTFTDNFNGYTNYYKDICSTESIITNNWGATGTSDINSVTLDTNRARFGTASIRGQALPSVFDQNYGDLACDATTANVTDYNAQGRVYAWLYIDGNFAQDRQFSNRVGTSAAAYNAYYNTDGEPWNEAFYNGWNIYQEDLNNVGAFGGSGWAEPWTSMGWGEVRTSYGYDGHPTDHNFMVSGYWMEKVNGSTNGTWSVLISGGRPFGWARPINYTGSSYALSIAPTDRPGFLRLGEVFYTPVSQPSIRTADYNFSGHIDVRQMDTSMKTQIMFDWNAFTTYNAVSLIRGTTDDINLVLESYVSGVRTATIAPITVTRGQWSTISWIGDGNNYKISVDGVQKIDANVTRGLNGTFGIDSNNGQTQITNMSLIYTLGGQPSTTSTPNPTYNIGATSPIFPIVIIVLAIVLIALFAGLAKTIIEGAFDISDLGGFFAAAIFLFIIIIVFLQLYFAGGT